MQNITKFLVSLFLVTGFYTADGQEVVMRSENALCLGCHSQQTFTMFNEWTGREERRLMNPYHIIDTTLFLTGVHQTFSCVDCHSMDYEEYPHLRELKLEPMMSCNDCHGGDPYYAHYQFDRIEEEFEKSVHYLKGGDNFSCAKCHNQHYYRPTARTSANVADIVSADNQMCLSCHTDAARYRLTTVQDFPVFREVHAWLPNHELHFRSVRCIDCHTAFEDDLMVAHNILTKEEAVRNCSECHSANTLLRATLYRYENIQSRQTNGVFASILQEQPYIIGANQVPIFKFLSVALLLATIFGIAIHATVRVVSKRKK